MKSILFGWELGSNLGHAKPLASVAGRLTESGVRLIVAARDLMYARLAFEGTGAQIFQAPIWPNHRHFGVQGGEGGYLDLLVSIGFADARKLSAVVAGWTALIDQVKPDVVVADHSPGLLLAAQIRGIPVVHVGSGFTMPPLTYDRFPPIRAERGPIMPETRLFAAAAEVMGEFGGRKPRAFLDLFRTAARVVYGFPELDPYAAFRREVLHLPPEPLPHFTEVPVEPRIFAYLGPETPNVDQLLQVMSALDVPIEFYLRGEISTLGRFLSLRGHRVHEKPPRLADVLPTVSHVISGGGIFTCHAALAAGRPMLVIPVHAEADINAFALERIGAGKRLDASGDAKTMRTAIVEFLRDHRLLRDARHWAKVFAARNQPDGLRATLEAIRCYLGIPQSPDAGSDIRPASAGALT